MIYLEMSDAVVNIKMFMNKHLMTVRIHDDITRQIDIETRLCANVIFEIENGVTKYFKDRYGTGYQYTPEDEVVLRLRSVLI